MKKSEVTQPVAMATVFAENVYSKTSTENFEIPAATSSAGDDTCVLDNGFLPITSTALDAGGIAPERKNFNGMFYLSTDQRVFLQNGGFITYNPDVAAEIGGYPKDAILGYIDSNGLYSIVQSLIDDNSNNFTENPAYIDNIHWRSIVFDGADRSLSNLTTLGNARLHALKGYLDNGELLSDTEGYSDVYNYAHSTFDLTKFTVIGSPNIIADGVASGFSNSNYLTTNYTMPQGTYTFDIKGSFTTGSSIVTETTPISFSGGRSGFLFQTTSSIIKIYNTTDNSNWGDYWASADLTPNTKYYYRVLQNDTACYFYFGTSKDNLVLVGSTSNLARFLSGSIYIGTRSQNLAQYWRGSIDIRDFSVTINNVKVFSGNNTGIDTIYINGNNSQSVPVGNLDIPYTLSKTGSKIVNSQYRDYIQALYEEQGYAPYYTLDEENQNFTLPMGEVYGMIQRAENNIADLKNNVTSLVMPDYSQKISIASGWIATFDCLISIMGSADIGSTIVSIDNTSFEISYDTGDGQSAASGQFWVAKGSTVTFNTARSAYAIPLKGSVPAPNTKGGEADPVNPEDRPVI